MKKDAYVMELERQDILLRERIEQLCREKEYLEGKIQNGKEIVLGCYEMGVMCQYNIDICFQTDKKGYYDKLNVKIRNRLALLDFFSGKEYDLICHGRETPIIKIFRPGIRLLPAVFVGNAYHTSYISLYDTPKLPDSGNDSEIQMLLTHSGKRKILYKADGSPRKTMAELIDMVKEYLVRKEAEKK